MSILRLAFKSAAFFWRTNFAIALGVAAAVAILVGALLIGESMRGSLKALTVDRLGDVDDVLMADHFFRQDLAREMLAADQLGDFYSTAIPVIVLPEVTVEHRAGDKLYRAVDATLYAVPDEVWDLHAGDAYPLGPQQVAVNRRLAGELGLREQAPSATAAPRVTLRITIQQQLSSDSALGKKRDLVHSLPEIPVVHVIEDHGLGRFGMRPTQLVPQNVFVSLAWLQEQLGHELFKGKDNAAQANAIWLRRRDNHAQQASLPDNWPSRIPCTLADLGLRWSHVARRYVTAPDTPAQTAFEYFSLSADKLVFDESSAGHVRRLIPEAQPVFTYLANQIQLRRDEQLVGEAIPFSMVSGWDWTAESPLISAATASPIAAPGARDIVLNEWAANDLGAQIGDTIRLTYFEPEAVGGSEVERSADFRVLDIARFVEPVAPFRRRGQQVVDAVYDKEPSLANDPDFTPLVPGLTDAESIESWSLPFDTPGIRRSDDEYWSNHRTTPKAFVALETARSLWRSRFGETTSFRISDQTNEEELRGKIESGLRAKADDFGIQLIPLRANGLRASSGATPFDLLFLGLSSFVMLSALILVTLMVRLALQQRVQQLGILAAVGFGFTAIVRIWIAEMVLVCVVGGIAGIALGMGYAQFMLWGLRNWWVGALGTPFVQLHWSPLSIGGGAFLGVLIGLLAIVWTLWRLRRRPTGDLLAGRFEPTVFRASRGRRISYVLIGICALGAIGLLIAATKQAGEAQAGMFFGSGFLALGGQLLLVRNWLRRAAPPTKTDFGFGTLAVLNARRNPLRSTLTIGLVAVASFLIAAISAFRITPDAVGRGGFDFIATSNQPLFDDLNTEEGRKALLLDPARFPRETVVVPFRLKSGDDASCTNPFQVSQPRVLGVSAAARDVLSAEQGTPFAWAGSLSDVAHEPWQVLAAAASRAVDAAIPAVIDKNTAWYSLKIFQLGTEFEVQYDTGERVRFQLAGLLNNSILQGSLLISEEDFRRVFPDEAGHRYFLIRTAPQDRDAVITQLENDLSDQGFDGRDAHDALAELLAVQNTYLSAFQALGALGLLLGTIGLAAVQLRNIFERRKELALFRAVGYSDSRLVWLVFVESFSLLVLGVGIGIAAAVLAVLPHFLYGNAGIPWGPLGMLFVGVLAIGWVVVWWSSRSVLRAPLLTALRDSA